ncbi:MAG TPA: organic hydroperoxide resistance protein [Kribbellaceae bacterium]
MNLDKILYTARATAEGGRDGRTATDDGKLDVIVAPPKELGGSGDGTNPEQLFAAGFAACFHNAFQLVARKARQDVSGSTVTAEVGIGPVTGGVGYGLTVHLEIDVPSLDREIVQQLVATADQVCPYSNATRGNIAITHTVA